MSNFGDCRIRFLILTFPLILGSFVIRCDSVAIAESSTQTADSESTSISIGLFDFDATPPLGSMMAYDRVRRIDELGLRCRGIVLIGAGNPIVLCAMDWIGIANDSHDQFRSRIAKAAKTSPERVAVHCLHQHDAPRCDFSSERLLHSVGATDVGPMEGSFPREVLDHLDTYVTEAIRNPKKVTHIGYGVANVDKIASNRRILGEDGRIRVTRYTATRNPEVRAEPIGVIDPELSCITFWNNKEILASLTYYACHPQSYYRTGIPSPDFPGIARFMRGQDAPGTVHLHFNGAGGNIGAGKYNDGSTENRLVLASRMADAMREAWESTIKAPISSDDLDWQTKAVQLPVNKSYDYQTLSSELTKQGPKANWNDAATIAWMNRCRDGHAIDIGCLTIGNIRVLHMPGELFVEFQLAAKAMRPNLNVCMTAYGDYGPGYIGTAIAYEQGGYEASDRASRVDERAEPLLMDAMKTLLQVEE